MSYPPPPEPPADPQPGSYGAGASQPYGQQASGGQEYGAAQSPYGQPYPSYPAAPGRPGRLRLRGRIPLRLALIFGVVGLAMAIVGVVVGLTQGLNKVNGFSRVSITSEISTGTARFGHAGNYVAYYENKHIDRKKIPIPLIQLTSPSGSQMLLTKVYGGGTLGSSHTLHKYISYDHDSHNGVAVLQFHISEPGTYQVRIETNLVPSGSDIAFGVSIVKGLAIGGVLLIVGVPLIIAAIVLFIVGLVKRSRSKRELANGYAGYGGGGYPPSGAGYQPPGSAYPPPGGGYSAPGSGSYEPPSYPPPAAN